MRVAVVFPTGLIDRNRIPSLETGGAAINLRQPDLAAFARDYPKTPSRPCAKVAIIGGSEAMSLHLTMVEHRVAGPSGSRGSRRRDVAWVS